MVDHRSIDAKHSSPFRRALAWLSGADSGTLPARVQRDLERQQQQNEILVGWVQAALILTFALLYAFSRKTFTSDAAFHPVPWALGIYALFTALRLFLAYCGRLGHTLRICSVLVDMSVLMVTIWSFHLQYGQPPAFYLKAPTLFYVFIFIALRVLSLVPGHVLLAGVTAATGWLILLMLAIDAPGGFALITYDYVAYMTTRAILIGGEVDKIIAILLASVLLAVATARTRALLARAVTEEAAATQLSRFFSPEIAETIVSSNEVLNPGEGRQTEAAAMFIDMRGFTKLAADLSPPDLIALLREYQRVAVPVIQRNGGSITTYLGDGIMVTFGATRTTTTYAADALRAAEQLLDGLDAWAVERRAKNLPAPGVGIGVAAGTVTCGTIGEEGRLEYAVIGDPVNRAAKLQNHTKVEAVRALCTCYMLDIAIGQGYDDRRTREIRKARAVAGVAAPEDLAVIK